METKDKIKKIISDYMSEHEILQEDVSILWEVNSDFLRNLGNTLDTEFDVPPLFFNDTVNYYSHKIGHIIILDSDADMSHIDTVGEFIDTLVGYWNKAERLENALPKINA